MKNREITENEINRITKQCPPREQAFFTVIRQSGLPPHIIKQLKIRDVEEILEPNPPIPCKINIPHEKSPTFVAEEAIYYLKQYLRTRKNLTPESLLFTIRNNPNKEINTKDVSRTFRQVAQKLQRANKITFEVKKGKPSELRLYNLVRFYRKKAKNYLAQLSDNTPTDDESLRKLYEEIAMPLLEIEPLTPIKLHQLRKQQQELENKLKKIENFFPKETPKQREEMEKLIKEHEEYIKWSNDTKQEQHLEEEQKKQKKFFEEHPEEAKRYEEQMNATAEEMERLYIHSLEEEVKELKNKLKELEDIITEHIKTRHFSKRK